MHAVQLSGDTSPLQNLNLRLPKKLRARLRYAATKKNMSCAEYVRRLIMDATGHELATRLVPPSPPVPPAPLKAPPEVKFTLVPETAQGLWARGFTANQIAARLRKPYKKVLAEIYGEGQIDPDT